MPVSGILIHLALGWMHARREVEYLEHMKTKTKPLINNSLHSRAYIWPEIVPGNSCMFISSI